MAHRRSRPAHRRCAVADRPGVRMVHQPGSGCHQGDPGMKAEHILPQLEMWQSVISRVDEQLKALSGVVGQIDGPLVAAIEALQDEYTGLVANNVGCSQWPDECDYLTDLHWYHFECRLGSRSRLAFVGDGERFEVSDLESLAKLIEMTEAE